MVLFRRGLWLWVVLLASSTAARAQHPILEKEKAKLDECYRVVGKDSVVFFYSADYLLTPPGCAAIRRHTQLDSAGRFWGPVHDYSLITKQLLLRGAYHDGLMEGQFEVYHETGELAARGHYQQGRQVGDWGYWYASGRRRQVLSFRNGQPPLIQQFWNESDQQLVKDGKGSWYSQEDGLQLSGKVMNGAPDGRWQLRRALDNTLVAKESFVKGSFRNGVVVNRMELYRDQSRLPIADWEKYRRAEQYELNVACYSRP